MDKLQGKQLTGSIIVKTIGLLGACIVTLSAFLGHRPLLGVGFIFFGLMMCYEVFIVVFRNRSIGYKDQLPFIIPFFLCLLFDFII
jgi:hypothetical protein